MKKSQEAENREGEVFLDGEDAVRIITAQRLRWFGHEKWRAPMRMIRRVMERKTMKDRSRGRLI